MKTFKEIYQYRELFKTNVKKEIRGKYKGSFLGILWSFINPLLMVAVYAIVFPYIMKIETDNYLVFLICGIIPWNFFTSCLTMGTTVITNNGNLIKKVYFPREILPLSIVTSGLVNLIISMIIIFIFVIFSGIGLSWYILLLPLILVIQFLITLALVMVLSAINVYVKDVEYMVTFLTMLLFYATPVLYTTDLFNGPILWIFKLNPMAHLISAYRDIFYMQQMPNMINMVILLVLAIIFTIIGTKIFKKLERNFAEEI